ncbi:hypothetical protein [Streptomyces sp. ITFR-6]|uniref:hypothetical protein n=1 Tax=Streptomyces sp. ITFR-6 TaxID=3075197 RepID=UPI0028891570|nr:hypothetical protein [Streptomyces sp. ITFR-6]WNI29296.1 hypothetical protein RLT59_11245 [Streptomyces sp. ITFR-6]
MSDVRELLGRAAEDAGRPVISTEAVYAKAARVRWRRRAGISAAAVCAVAAGAFVVPGLSSGPATQDSSGEPAPADCVREELPGGRVLTIWSDAMNYGGVTPEWGPELVGRLMLEDGSMLGIRDSTGFEADTAQGPLLKTPPLTRAQLRTLILSPELLPKK